LGWTACNFFPKIIEEDYADVVCIGEGEDAALDFAMLLIKMVKNTNRH
jgi:radical SAM superfamily enzyme YgiQ (UPF0313 family)